MNIARIGNKYISDTEPWKVAKTDMDRCVDFVYIAADLCQPGVALNRSALLRG